MRSGGAGRPTPSSQAAGISGAILLLRVGPPAGPARSLPTLRRAA